jgi:hypothetical protein
VRAELFILWSLALSALLGCAAHPRVPAADARSARELPVEALRYRFTLDPQLRTLDAEVCFRGKAPPELVCGVSEGAQFLSAAWQNVGGAQQALPVKGGRVSLASVPDDGCIGYRIDLVAASESGGVAARRRGDAVLTNVAIWLWRPARWDLIREATAQLALPAGMQVQLPWPERPGGGYTLDTSAFAFYGFAAFGRFDVEHVTAPAATIDVAVLEGLSEATRTHIVPWIEAAARIASQPLGRFPREHATIVVVPTPSGDPVRFGIATRGGGASILLLVSPDAQLEPLVHDWIAVHEFSHLMHPFVSREDAWLSEGLATYYQEIARVRGGVLSEAEAWRRIYDGSLLATGARGSLADESAHVFERRAFPRVYWAGASFALLADAELRLRTGGKTTLDDVIRGLHACCAREARPTPARQVIARMDQIAGVPVFSELMQRWVLGPHLPELSALYTRLGLLPGPDGVRITGQAAESWIRAAIMAPQPAPSSAAAQ